MGPYKIVELQSDNLVVIQLPDGLKVVHMNNLSHAMLEMIYAKLRYDGHQRLRHIPEAELNTEPHSSEIILDENEIVVDKSKLIEEVQPPSVSAQENKDGAPRVSTPTTIILRYSL